MEMRIETIITTINIEGEDYFSLSEFSYLSRRSESNIRALFNKGNRIRKLKKARFGNSIFIVSSELVEFPFIVRGKNPLGTNGIIEKFHFDDGKLCKREEVYEN